MSLESKGKIMTKILQEEMEQACDNGSRQAKIYPRDDFYAGFRAAHEILIPLILEQREALEFYARREHWGCEEDYQGFVVYGIIDIDDQEKIKDLGHFEYGGKRARKALEAGKKLGL